MHCVVRVSVPGVFQWSAGREQKRKRRSAHTLVNPPARTQYRAELCDANAVIFRIEDGAKLSVRSLSFKL